MITYKFCIFYMLMAVSYSANSKLLLHVHETNSLPLDLRGYRLKTITLRNRFPPASRMGVELIQGNGFNGYDCMVQRHIVAVEYRSGHPDRCPMKWLGKLALPVSVRTMGRMSGGRSLHVYRSTMRSWPAGKLGNYQCPSSLNGACISLRSYIVPCMKIMLCQARILIKWTLVHSRCNLK